MPSYCVVQSGDSNAAATYGTIANTPTVHATTNINITSGGINTESWTAPNTVNAVLGVCLAFTAKGTGTVVAQLQEGGVDVAGVSVSISLSAIETNRWIFFKLATAHTYTSTAAGHYRWRIYHTGHSGTSTLAAASTTSLCTSRSIDDRTGVPASGDPVMNVGANASTEYTLTLKGTQTVGAFSATYATLFTNANAWRTATHDFYIGDRGTVKFDTTAGGTFTVRGVPVVGRGATCEFGTEASPIAKANNWTFIIDQNGATGTNAFLFDSGGTDQTVTAWGEEVITHGVYLSGTGTLADPIVLSEAMDFTVGDKIVIAGDVYNQYEERTIASVISSTEYELSSALTNTHASGTPVIQMTYSIKFTSNDPAQYWFLYPSNTQTGLVKFRYVKFENIGGTITSRRGLQTAIAQGNKMEVDYCGFENIADYAWNLGFSRETETFTGNVFYNNIGTQNGGTVSAGTVAKKTFVDSVFIAMERNAFLVSSSYVCTFTDCKMWNCGIDNNSNTGGAQIVSSGGLVFENCEIEASRTNAFVFQNASNIRLQSCSLGSIAANNTAFSTVSDQYNPNILADNCDFGAGTVFNAYTSQVTGSELVIANKNGVDFANFIYKPEGIIQFTGAGLDDTTVSPLGNRCLRFAPEDATTGLTLEFKIPVFVGGAAQLYGKAKINSLFGSDTVDAEIYLPESADPLTPDEVVTYGYTTGDWVTFQIAKEYTGTNPGLARVVIRAKSATAGAYLYISDLYDATDETNPLASFGAAFEGKPSPVIASTIYDYFGVWTVLTSTLSTSGTIGNLLSSTAKLIYYLTVK